MADPRVDGAVDGALAAIAQISSVLEAEHPEEARWALERLLKAWHKTHALLQLADPDLLLAQTLSNIQSFGLNISAHPLEDPSTAHNLAEQLLAQTAALVVGTDADAARVGQLAAAMKKIQSEAASRAGGYKSQAEQAATMLEQAASRAIRSIDEKRATAEARVDEVVAYFEEQFSLAKATLDELADEQAATFLAAQEARAKEASDAQASLQGKLDLVQKQAETQIADFLAAAGETKQSIDELAAEAKVVVGATAGKETVDHYHDLADAQRTEARIWRVATVVLLLSSVASAVIVAYVFHASFRGALIAPKLAISTLLAAASFYTAKQSAVHRRREMAARKTELELRAFSPFLAPIRDEQKEIERVIFARRTFGRPEERDEDGDDLAAFLNPLRFWRDRDPGEELGP